jgi:hypothetical protein
MQKKHLFIFIILIIISQACTVSLINTGIDYTVLESFSLEQFEVKNSNAPPTSGQLFSEQLKDRILNNTRLRYLDQDGDIQFSGDVTGYNITALAPQANQTVAFQRLTIQLTINYKDIKQKDGANDWNQNFSRFANFSAEQDLSSVEDALIQEIYVQVLDDVFNKAFSGW